MKKRVLIHLCMLTLVFLLLGCTATVLFDQQAATAVFLDWLTTNGIPDFPETPMVGLLLGTVELGDIVSSFSPVSGSSSRASAPLAERGWLFYLDERAGGFYEHPGKIVVVGVSGSIIHLEATNGWPIVNGVRPHAIDSPTSADYFDAIIWNPWELVQPITGIKDWLLEPLFPRIKGAIVVNGLISDEALYAEGVGIHSQVLTDMQTLFTVENVSSLISAAVVANPAQRIENAVEDLFTNHNVNNITLYMIGHGNTDLIVIGGYGYYANDLRALIQKYSNVHFAVILETCYAGSWLNNFMGELALTNLGIFIASTSADHGAWPDWDSAVTGSNTTLFDFDPSDAYIEWTSDFLKQLAAWSTGANWTTVQNYANTNNIESEWALYYYSFYKVKGSLNVPPNLGSNFGATTYTMAERTGVDSQSPQVLQNWFVLFPPPLGPENSPEP